MEALLSYPQLTVARPKTFVETLKRSLEHETMKRPQGLETLNNMYKRIYYPASLTCLQHDGEPLHGENFLTGVLSESTNGEFRFVEMVRKGRPPRNPKLYDGKFVSMVRQRNGKYQLHLKTIDKNADIYHFAFGVYSEIINAISIING